MVSTSTKKAVNKRIVFPLRIVIPSVKIKDSVKRWFNFHYAEKLLPLAGTSKKP